ncbi:MULTISPECIES: DUF4870 domain-containing protein [unclassified Pseudoalteromonas]|uniref:DUF4870 domain-containing protein n=1 Tax=unclassified Pseudoalteromonas TaxID=194690 RepID=UPI000B3BF779|nr:MULTISPECIES: DUF4870 domain-containing protein [unclassified Pseudoalteromonas]MDN3378792.1 DUF4870 domain-containing protein [Pseudoalteromonas sp. APC 3893]MDN3387280.1 DUF4870 domain-containing protein [Pseudoalteromonas sp. APC 4017]OUS73769.1 orotate phosphoribosyltransferase [Pseudoalteromonas sp. A601]
MEENQQVEPVEVDKEQRTWAMLCHLSALAGFIVPMGSIIGPLIVWLIKKDEMPIVNEHGKKSLNFQITMLIAYIICFILMFVVIGVILLPIVAVFSFVMVVIGAIKANDGKEFNYPITLNLIK